MYNADPSGEGLGKTTMYCGDGINDLVALHVLTWVLLSVLVMLLRLQSFLPKQPSIGGSATVTRISKGNAEQYSTLCTMLLFPLA